MQIKNLILKILSFVIFLSLFSCGDIFSTKKNIIGRYYLFETDIKNNYLISYKTDDGDYIGRVPPNVFEYCVIPDSLIIAKSLQNGNIFYYLIKINQDGNYADQKEFLIGPMNEIKFNLEYNKNLNIKFTKVF